MSTVLKRTPLDSVTVSSGGGGMFPMWPKYNQTTGLQFQRLSCVLNESVSSVSGHVRRIWYDFFRN